MRGLFLLRPDAFGQIYGPAEVAAIEHMVEIYAPPQSAESIQNDPAILRPADLILSGWGLPKMDAAFLALAPHLQAVFYGAGSVKGIVTDAFWERGIQITSAAAANAVPVVEYTLSQILFCLKLGWRHALEIKQEQRYPGRHSVLGAYGRTVGIVSLGLIGRRVCEMLRPFDLQVIAYDPFISQSEAATLDAELVTLAELFQRADVVSLHTPWLKETEGLITGAHFAAMKPDAAFINTARGAIVREDELITVLQQRPDIQAVLDVTYPEPPVAGSPLYTLPNVILTPHIAGSMNGECRRMGRMMVDELARFVKAQPLQWAVTPAKEAVSA